VRYLFRTRLGRWWHCLTNFHQPATAYLLVNDKNVVHYACWQCMLDHDVIVQRLKRVRRMGESIKDT
jgi:hypothetical protein